MTEDEIQEDARPRVDPATLAFPTEPLPLEEVASLKEGGDPRIVQIVRDYFGQFCRIVYLHEDDPSKKQQCCPACGTGFTGLMASLGFGAGIEWGLAHGEGHCSICRWPYRGHHFIYDPEEIKDYDPLGDKDRPEPLMTIHNFFLAYLPDAVSGWIPPIKSEY